MTDFIKQFEPLLPFLLRAAMIVFLFLFRKEIFQFIKGMLSEDGAGVNISSRRGIAFAAAWTLFILCFRHYQDINPMILWILLLLVILCLGLATISQVLEMVGKLKNLVPGSPPQPDATPQQDSPPSQIKVTTEVNTQSGT